MFSHEKAQTTPGFGIALCLQSCFVFHTAPDKMGMTSHCAMDSQVTGEGSSAIEQVHNKFICAHHDGCVWDLSDQVRCESSVKSAITFLSKHQTDTLEKRAVLVALFS